MTRSGHFRQRTADGPDVTNIGSIAAWSDTAKSPVSIIFGVEIPRHGRTQMSSDEVSPRSLAGGRLRVAVASDQYLVAESVRAALRNRGHDTVGVRWPVLDGASGAFAHGTLRLRRRGRAAGPPPDVAVLLSDLARGAQVRSAQLLIEALDVPWMVLAGVPHGPAWGALYASGARVVVPTDTSLDELCQLLADLCHGRTPLAAARRRDLVKAWHSYAQLHDELTARLTSLTVREEEVLQQLYQGYGVRLIAERGEVTEATVRSQVKAILRKLEVNSQLAAVAAYQEVQAAGEGVGLAPHAAAAVADALPSRRG
jgi:DNA-binding NarL/FixJ family response regulator